MNRRKTLVNLVKLMTLVSVVAISIPFISSLQPSNNAGSTLPHIYINDLQAGSYLLEDSGRKGWLGIRWLILKDYDKQVYVYSIPTNDDKTMMPDHQWFRLGGYCENFHPEMVNNLIKPNGVIRCHDHASEERSVPEWRWNYRGKNLGKHTADMQRPRFKIEGGYLVIGG